MPRVKRELIKKEQMDLKNLPQQSTTPEPKTTGTIIRLVGRRKTASASVFFSEQKGQITVNSKPINDYFFLEEHRNRWLRPFHAVGISHPEAQCHATVMVRGSGISSQLEAVVHGLSRALAKSNEEYAKTLRKQGFLTRDPRMVERKKYYLKKARKAPQYSKR